MGIENSDHNHLFNTLIRESFSSKEASRLYITSDSKEVVTHSIFRRTFNKNANEARIEELLNSISVSQIHQLSEKQKQTLFVNLGHLSTAMKPELLQTCINGVKTRIDTVAKEKGEMQKKEIDQVLTILNKISYESDKFKNCIEKQFSNNAEFSKKTFILQTPLKNIKNLYHLSGKQDFYFKDGDTQKEIEDSLKKAKDFLIELHEKAEGEEKKILSDLLEESDLKLDNKETKAQSPSTKQTDALSTSQNVLNVLSKANLSSKRLSQLYIKPSGQVTTSVIRRNLNKDKNQKRLEHALNGITKEQIDQLDIHQLKTLSTNLHHLSETTKSIDIQQLIVLVNDRMSTFKH